MALVLAISAKEFPEIGTVGETPNFADFTDAEKALAEYAKLGIKEIEVDATAVLAGQVNENDGKTEVLSDVEIQTTTYLNGIFTDSAKTYTAKVYVLATERKCSPPPAISPSNYTTGNYVPQSDIMTVQTRIEVLVS